ncbi:MAG: hypothetical protein ACLGSH_14465 [Acidobacteriota bacterium]
MKLQRQLDKLNKKSAHSASASRNRSSMKNSDRRSMGTKEEQVQGENGSDPISEP